MRRRRSNYRQSEENSKMLAPPSKPVVWRVVWYGGSATRTAQTAHQAWSQVHGAPHFSACKVEIDEGA